MYRYYIPTAFRDMDRMQRQMERMARAFYSDNNEPASYPAMNVWVKDDEMVVTAELPGFTPENINVSVVNDTLTVSGSHPDEDLPEGGRYHRRECACGEFSRTVRLPYQVDANKVEAVFEKGILRIHMQRTEEDKPRKISIRSN